MSTRRTGSGGVNVRQWARDLAMGARFAFSGRGGIIRAGLTAVGVGLGVALLLLTTAIPNALTERHARGEARDDYTFVTVPPPRTDATLLVADADTTFRADDIRGRKLQPEGAKAVPPPGVAEFPAPGTMVVSPALKELLESSEGALLRERLPDRIVGTIAEPGLIGSHDLVFYQGAEGLERSLGTDSRRIDGFGRDSQTEPWDPVLLLLILVVVVVLLMPVAVFVAAAERFGSDGRDRRLAALRLVGSDSRMTRRVAAGEALAGSLLGLLVGTGFFLVARQAAGSAELFDLSVFPSYLNPSPLLVAVVALLVPAAAVAVTLFALRGVVIEPLGVVRTARPRRRRLWWRLLLPLAGLAMLYPMLGQGSDGGEFNQYLVTGGVVLLLVGVTALLPWIVERFVGRLGGGPVAWQLAVRRLQLSSGTAARTVNGIAVAVAGAIALQMLFTGVEDDYTRSTGRDVSSVEMQVALRDGTGPERAVEALAATEGVRTARGYSDGYIADRARNPELGSSVTVADCALLREVAKLPSCTDGDVFVVPDAAYDPDTGALAEQGRTVWFDASYDDQPGDEVPWKLPALKRAEASDTLTGSEWGGVLVTPKALPAELRPQFTGQVYLTFDRTVPDAYDLARNAVAAVDPLARTMMWVAEERVQRFETIRTGLFVGAAAVLMLIGASLLVSQLEQLRERKKLLSVLVAFGTRRGTLTLSVLWQTAIPIIVGLILANAVGLTLGAILLRMSDTGVGVDWVSVLTMTGIGAGVVLAVTALSLPPLLRLMRPDGLRTE
ncbi:FtsX-like permease family protein [Streptomyces sp. NPDC093252]|uniref:ABC transporter permease n=1 Tax=Streptomyces sp. NPDC093252 TaxID=3154980 RepID=UPI003425E6A8